jgi:magnesium transporter
MQRLVCRRRGAAVAVACDPGQLAVARRDSEWVWLDLADPSAEELATVGEVFEFDALSLQDVLDETVFPKVDDHRAYLFVVLHGVVAEGQERITTGEFDFFLGPDFLVTAHRSPIVAVEWMADHVTQNAAMTAAGVAGIAAGIAEAGGRRYLPLLDALDERIEAIEELAIVADPQTLSESQALRRDVILLRRVLGPQRDVLRQLATSASPLLDERARRGFGDVYDHHFRLVESLDAARALLGSTVDTYRGAVAERTNEVMKVLTVFSAILLPLGLIAGLWGMNFSEIPASAERWGFVGILGVMAVIAVGLWLYFAQRGFVGGPRLRELPKAVGLGLIHVGTAPIRVVTGLVDLVQTSPEDRTASTDRRGEDGAA